MDYLITYTDFHMEKDQTIDRLEGNPQRSALPPISHYQASNFTYCDKELTATLSLQLPRNSFRLMSRVTVPARGCEVIALSGSGLADGQNRPIKHGNTTQTPTHHSWSQGEISARSRFVIARF